MHPHIKEEMERFGELSTTFFGLKRTEADAFVEAVVFLRREATNFFLSSHLSLLEKYVERLRGQMIPRRCKCKNFPCDIHYSVGDKQASGYNSALQSEIEYLQAEVEKIKKL